MKHLAYASLAALLFSGAAATLCQAAEPDVKLLGDPVPATATERTIVIQPGTTHVNVTDGDVVKFVIGNQTFAWDFDTGGKHMVFDLERIAPAGTLDHKVLVYVSRDPTYLGA